VVPVDFTYYGHIGDDGVDRLPMCLFVVASSRLAFCDIRGILTITLKKEERP